MATKKSTNKVTSTFFKKKTKKKGKASKTSNNKNSKCYAKPYRGQGR